MITSLPSGSSTRATRSPHGWSVGSSVTVAPPVRSAVTVSSQSSAYSQSENRCPLRAGPRLGIQAEAEVRRAEVQGDVSRCALGRELVRHGPAEQVAVEAQCPVEVRSADDGERGADHGLVLSVGVYGVVVYGSTVEQATNRRSRVVALWTDSWKSARGGYRSGEPTAASTTRTCMSITATEHIHDEVRELIRRRGIDPITDHRSTRLLIDEVISEYEDRVPVSALPPLMDRAGAVRHVFDSLAGFGPLQRFLDDPSSRGDLDQPARPGVRRAARPLRADDRRARPRRGARPGGAHAQAVRPAARPVLAVRRRAAAGREPAARGDPGHHPRAPQPEHPQVRRGRERARRSGGARLHHRPRRPLPGGRGRPRD